MTRRHDTEEASRASPMAVSPRAGYTSPVRGGGAGRQIGQPCGADRNGLLFEGDTVNVWNKTCLCRHRGLASTMAA